MKKEIIRLAAILVMIATTLSLCACEPTFERLQRKLGISFDNIICQYSTWITDSDPLWTSWEEKKEITSTNITFYADNTVVIWTSKVAYDTDIPITQTTAQITEDQKNQLIEAIKSNNLPAVGNCSEENRYYGKNSWIYLYDENGRKVHSCGGINPSHPSYNAVLSLIKQWFPSNDERITSVESYTEMMLPFENLLEFVSDKTGDDAISGDTYVFTIMSDGIITTRESFKHPINLDYSYTMLPDGNLEVKSVAWAEIEGYGTTEKREVTTIIDLTPEQTEEVIELIMSFFEEGAFIPADENRMEILINYCSIGRLLFYNSDGSHIYTHYSDDYTRNSRFSDLMYDFDPYHWTDYQRAAVPLAEEDVVSILGPQQQNPA